MRQRYGVCILFLAFSMLGILTGPVPARAEGDMKIFPVSPYFTDTVRSQHVNIVNNSERAATFRVDLSYNKQNEDGSPTPLEASPYPDIDLSKVVIFSPRQVFLQPGDIQTVKMAVRRPENFPEGEYRIYLKLMRMDSNGPAIDVAPGTPGGRIRGRISMQVSYALPVVVRHGKSDATANLSDFKLISGNGKTGLMLQMNINRAGKYSTMGRVSVYWTPPGQSEKSIGKAGNVNVFPELNKRIVSVPLTELAIQGGTLRVVYDGSPDSPDKGKTFDEKVFPVAGG